MSKKRVFGLGIDGAPHSLLADLASRGVMPNVKKLTDAGGTLAPMDTSIPEISAIAWTCLFTGENPGGHGLFGFVDLKPGTYKMTFPNSTTVKAPAVWDDLAKQGKRSVVINMPSTYPAREINGVLVAGFVAISLEKATWPKSMIPQLKAMGYRIDVDTMAARKDLGVLKKDLIETLDKRIELTWKLWDREDWDYFSPVITGTDRLQHFLMPAYKDPSHPDHGFFLEYYAKIDRWIGQIADRLDDQTTFLMYSDHGFTEIEQEVHLNTWLQQEGYLKYRADPPKGYEDLDPSTKAFALDPSRIYIHTKGRWPEGTVDPAEKDGLIDEIMAKAQKLTNEAGEPIIDRVYRADRIYTGPCVADGPDVILVAKYGYDLKGALGRPTLFGRTPLVGMHTQDDATFFINRPYDVGAKMDITRIKGLILESLE